MGEKSNTMARKTGIVESHENEKSVAQTQKLRN